ncbi:GroES-like protein [Hypoxylon fuscum]|nr:GroES-like protein [Hypoxylon fuscum]
MVALSMKAYRWNGPGTGLTLQDVLVPKPSAKEVLIEVQASGLCHSDCHIIDGSQASAIKKRPITLGHEVAGIVTAVGPGVDTTWVGERVTVALGGHPIRTPNTIGLQIDGGYADFAVARVESLVRIPENVSFQQAAIATDCLTTAYHAVRGAGEVAAGMNVGIIGLGGLGSSGLRIAVLAEANVYGFDVDTRRFDKALANGAKACFTDLGEAQDIVFDVLVDFVGKGATMAAALGAVKFRGRIVLVGLGEPSITVPTFAIVWNKVEIRGCLGGSMEDLSNVLELMSTGKLQPELEEIPFNSVNDGLGRLKAGNVFGRLYTCPRKVLE